MYNNFPKNMKKLFLKTKSKILSTIRFQREKLLDKNMNSSKIRTYSSNWFDWKYKLIEIIITLKKLRWKFFKFFIDVNFFERNKIKE